VRQTKFAPVQNSSSPVEFDVHTRVTGRTVFWGFTSERDRRFGGTQQFHVPCRRVTNDKQHISEIKLRAKLSLFCVRSEVFASCLL
jgi:hypothetical protein